MSGVADQRLWLGRGIYPTAASPMKLSPACRRLSVLWHLQPPQGVLCGTLYTDGSALHTDVRAAIRAGWGISVMCDDASPMITGAAYGALPLFTQASVCAEIFAAAIALSLACPPVVIATSPTRCRERAPYHARHPQ